MTSAIQKLTELFKDFPGIGPRQAKRFVYHLLRQPKSTIDQLADLIKSLESETIQCPSCFRYFGLGPNKKAGDQCEICLDIHTDESLLMLVEKDIDLETVKKSGVYTGNYFVLGGLVPILEKNPSTLVRSKELFAKIMTTAEQNALQEVIIAVSANPDGDNTVEYLKPILKPLQDKFGFKVSVLGRGLSTGTEIEYSDTDTLKNALIHRG